MLEIASEQAFDIRFKAEYRLSLRSCDSKKIALLVSREFEGKEQEGFYRNGGIGTYYRTLARKLAEAGWYVMLLVSNSDQVYGGVSKIAILQHVFSSHEIEEVLELQPSHRAILAEAKATSLLLDYESFKCLFFTKALLDAFPETQIYTEYHEVFGVGFRSIQAKRAGVLPQRCAIAITMHGCLEWVNEGHEKFVVPYLDFHWQAAHLEQQAFEQVDLAFFPSFDLKRRVESYGWKTTHALHQPYFIPYVELDVSAGSQGVATSTPRRQALVFFGRMEERKGFCTFVNALNQLGTDWHNQIEVHFVGKVVALQTWERQNIDSEQFLQRELKPQVEYTIHGNFSSREAIQFIADLDAPIVCLTSTQENFPNTALEMGQLPVRLLASDTGGFRETLQLIGRTEGVHWFEPRNTRSLAEALVRVLRIPVEPCRVPGRAELEAIDQRLLAQKLAYIEKAFQRSEPEARTTAPPPVTVVVNAQASPHLLLDCLHSLQSQTYHPMQTLVLLPRSRSAEVEQILQQAQSRFPDGQYLEAGDFGDTQPDYRAWITGEYVLPFDAGNIALPFAVEKLVEVLQLAQAEIATCPVTLFDGGYKIRNLGNLPLPTLLNQPGIEHSYSLLAVKLLPQAQYAGRIDGTCHDLQALTAALATGRTIAYYPYPLYYRRDDENVRPSMVEQLRNQYRLRQLLGQIDGAEWNRRQLYSLLSAVQQLHYEHEVSKAAHQVSGPDNQVALEQLQSELQQAQIRIAAMESSKFWQVRAAWFRFKRALGLPVAE